MMIFEIAYIADCLFKNIGQVGWSERAGVGGMVCVSGRGRGGREDTP